MGNPNTGEIYEGSLRNESDVPLSKAEADLLRSLPVDDRIARLRNMQDMLRQADKQEKERKGDLVQRDGTVQEMPRYKCHKEVWALKIKDIQQAPANQEALHIGGDWIIVPEEKGYVPFPVGHDWYTKHNPKVGGYYVIYKDGYQSYSPAQAFEEGYTHL